MWTRSLNVQDEPLLIRLRTRVASEHFKRGILGDLHVAQRAQASTLFSELESLAYERAPRELVKQEVFKPLHWLGFHLSDRAWEGWYGEDAHVPRPGKLRGLDSAAARLIRWRCPADGREVPLPADFYASLVHGGLLQTMLAPTEAVKPLIDLLRERARGYQPRSAWHLHLDALEVCAFYSDFGSIEWQDIVEVAAGRILDHVYRLWRPMDGQIYSSLSSYTRQQWEAATEVQRKAIRMDFAKLKPDLFDSRLVGGVMPSWLHAGITPDMPAAYVHRMLFAIGADGRFLQSDRLVAWSMDLATAGLAAKALAWADRYRQFGRRITEGQLILAAIDALLLSPCRVTEADHLIKIDRDLRAAMSCVPADWSQAGVEALHRGRAAYFAELADLGLTVEDVHRSSRRVSEKHCLVYVG
jgi:hypothetical protein